MNLYRTAKFDIGIHLLVWVVLLSVPSLFVAEGRYLGLTKIFFLLSSIYHIGIFYFIAYFLQPRLLNKKKWFLFVVCLPVLAIISFYLKLFFLQFDPGFERTFVNSKILVFGIVPFMVAAIIFRIITDRIRFEKLEKEARTEKLAAELKFLRSQISPHFLFNMMANMVSLARAKSELLEPSLIRLSELLRYMLYDSQREKIPVADEVEQLGNYVALQKLRFGDNVKVELNIRNEEERSLVEPMLLVPFIENAFKHGVGLQENAYIIIALSVRQQRLNFTVTNNYNKAGGSKDKNSGIGLANVQNRLELLYPGKYELRIYDDGKTFSVVLNLNLS